MIAPRRLLWPLLALVALVQSGALFKMVYDRDRLLKDGREIVLPVHPLDPRDLFRGDYVTLGYDITLLDKSSLPPDTNLDALHVNDNVFVTLSPDASRSWKITGISLSQPRPSDAADVVLKGRIQSLWRAAHDSDVRLNLRYGIESYFVPEGTGRALEEKVRERKIEAIVAVDTGGNAALKGLIIDGERHVDPPLF